MCRYLPRSSAAAGSKVRVKRGKLQRCLGNAPSMKSPPFLPANRKKDQRPVHRRWMPHDILENAVLAAILVNL